LAVLVLVVVTTHLVLGWFLANGLRKTALRVQPPTQGEGFAVREVSVGGIVLEAASPRQEIGHPGVIGLVWADGYGQTGDVTAVEDNRVSRGFRLIEGDLPAKCPDLPVAECPQVFPDGYAFPNGPGDVDLAFEEVTYPSRLGEMGAWVVPSKSEWWAIHVHGWTASRREAVRLLPSINRLGMTSIVIDYRNDPGAPTDPSGHYRFGLHEWEDVEAAVSYAIESGARHIVGVGYSTGAAHILSFLEQSRFADHVGGLVLDSPNVILADTVRHGAREARFPGLGFRVSPLLIELGMWIADLRWGIDWDRTNYVQRAESILRVPALVFHGTSDARVPISISRQLEARIPDLVELQETPAAGHVMSWNADPGRYERLLEDFLRRLQN
jgi:pimeloyl-ACP methyl ester carboxylesterase